MTSGAADVQSVRRVRNAAVLRWASRGVWAVTDQALFASSNFALNILLARWLPPPEFGTFAIAQSAFLLFGVMHTALLTEPMLIFATSRYADDFSSYLHYLVKWHWLFTGGFAGLFAIVAVGCWMGGLESLSYAFMGAAVATPPMLLVWMARRACFACFRPHYAAAGGALYLALMGAGLFALVHSAALSPASAFLLLGGCSLVVGLLLINLLRWSTGSLGRALRPQAILLEHWRYGRWAIASSTISWATGNVYAFLLPLSGGLATTASLRALENLVLPMLQVIVAVSTLLLPTLARARGRSQFRYALGIALALFCSGTLVYWILLGTFANRLIAILYAGQYAEHARLLWLLGVVPVIAGVVAVLSNALRAHERPQVILWAYVASACTTLSLGIWAAVRWELAGAILGEVIAALSTMAVLLVYGGRLWRDIPAAGSPAASP
jgi:O-antigen/teichoic acid export membrane protein